MSTIDFDPSKLKYVRKKLDLTQSAFAKEAGVSQSLIAKVEAGRIDPTFSKVKQIAEAVDRLSHHEEKHAQDLMTKDVCSVKPSEMVSDLVSTMSKRNISQVPVIDGHKVVGLVSEGNLLEARLKKPLTDLKVREVMSEPPPVISPTTPASAIMGLLRYFPAVLVSKDGAVQGIVTKADMLKSVLR